jgi:uncharacterized membrane protein YfcA
MDEKPHGGALMVVATAALGLVIGLVIGGLGGGGGALTVPAMVFLLGLTAQDATTSSVLIVGISSLVGAASRIRDRGLDWRTALAFGAVGVPVAHLGSVLSLRVSQPVVLLTFAAVTVVAAIAMLIESRSAGGAEDCDATPDGAERPDPAPAPGPGTGTVLAARPVTGRRQSVVRGGTVVGCGAAVGFLTGFLGVGGGFLVLPVLVIALRMPVTAAIGTSLLIMVLNSASALASRFGDLSVDWAVVVPFTLAAVVGTLLGRRVADRLSGAALTRIFALLLLLVGVLVGAESLLG